MGLLFLNILSSISIIVFYVIHIFFTLNIFLIYFIGTRPSYFIAFNHFQHINDSRQQQYLQTESNMEQLKKQRILKTFHSMKNI